MNRYKKANQGIHAPENLKQKVVQSAKPARRFPTRWGAVAAALALVLLAGAVLRPGGAPSVGDAGTKRPAATLPGASLTVRPLAIAQAVYPDVAPFPDAADYRDDTGETDYDAYLEDYAAWSSEAEARQSLPVDNEGMAGYYAATMEKFLGDNGGENAVYSPLNLYLALALLAECTDGDSRQQVLDLLGVDSIETLRTQASALWNANYQDDGRTTSLLANSVWLREGLSYNQDTLDTLAEEYYASTYQGEMGSEELNRALQGWLNESTGGLLEEYAQNIKTSPKTLLALVSAIYFKAAWADKFSLERTDRQVFHSSSGDRETDFMNQSGPGDYYWGENFSAVAKSFRNGGDMWLILPDEGTSPEELLAGDTLTRFLLAGRDWEGQRSLRINLSLPRFDVAAETDLIGGLQELGVTDVFDAGLADFTPVLGESGSGASVTEATHAARVKVDEEGCEAAAYTLLAIDEAAEVAPREIDFVLDRPFLFAVTSQTGQLLFVGIVNQV